MLPLELKPPRFKRYKLLEDLAKAPHPYAIKEPFPYASASMHKYWRDYYADAKNFPRESTRYSLPIASHSSALRGTPKPPAAHVSCGSSKNIASSRWPRARSSRRLASWASLCSPPSLASLALSVPLGRLSHLGPRCCASSPSGPFATWASSCIQTSCQASGEGAIG